jgi:hypothetical protein
MSRFVLLSALIILLFFASLALAGIPKMINYQGMLTQSDGVTPVVDTNYPILFKIYNASTSGTLKWSHTYNVSVANGLFNVVLGDSGAPINLPFDEDYWLDITVGGNTLSPRTRLTSVAYAYRRPRPILHPLLWLLRLVVVGPTTAQELDYRPAPILSALGRQARQRS